MIARMPRIVRGARRVRPPVMAGVIIACLAPAIVFAFWFFHTPKKSTLPSGLFLRCDFRRTSPETVYLEWVFKNTYEDTLTDTHSITIVDKNEETIATDSVSVEIGPGVTQKYTREYSISSEYDPLIAYIKSEGGYGEITCSLKSGTINCGNGECDEDETCESCPEDCGDCEEMIYEGGTCGDGYCDELANETYQNCPWDCPKSDEEYCGNGICDPYEDCEVCPDDCGVCEDIEDTCGNGECDTDRDENCLNCPYDCGDCTNATEVYSCGDGTCQAEYGEDCASCPEDCGDCEELTKEYCGNGECEPEYGEDCETCLEDCGDCEWIRPCGNGRCEPELGEDSETCPDDCPSALNESGPIVNGTCGDGICDVKGGECEAGCEEDCTVDDCCGNGVCNPPIEDWTTCPQDCEAPPSAGGTCGNDKCDEGECDSCPTDCTNEECCGNKECNKAFRECEYCPGDCTVEDCCGNGVCDTKVGETPDNCPNDCKGSKSPATSFEIEAELVEITVEELYREGYLSPADVWASLPPDLPFQEKLRIWARIVFGSSS